MQLVMHPHIVRLYEIIETHSDIYVVMEYVESGDLFDYIVLNGRLPEEEARHFFQQVQTLVFLQFVLLIHHMNKQQLNKMVECMLSHLNRVFKGCLSSSSSTFS
jgi:serine/threonine protein kinase